jgi:hypothetical protein
MPHEPYFFVEKDGKQLKIKIPRQQQLQQVNLDIAGKPINIKVEQFLD